MTNEDKIALFDERLYYIECKNGQYYLCTSREDGSDIRQIRNIPCGYGVSVNSKGIILYPSAVGEHKSSLKENEYGYVLWLDFSGNLKKKYNIIPKLATWTDFISIDLYVYGQMIFWSIYENDEMGGSGCRSKAYYMDLEVGETYQIYEGRKNGRRVSDIYGTEKKIVFSLKNHGSGDKIWYLYDIYSGITESMDNQNQNQKEKG